MKKTLFNCELLNRWSDPDMPRIEIRSPTGRALVFEKEYFDFVKPAAASLLDTLAQKSSGPLELSGSDMTVFKEAVKTMKLWARKMPLN